MSQSNAVNSTSEASKLLAHINASSAKLAEAEMAYAETVLELDVLLEPFYADADIRRTIAECSDRARKLFRLVLKFRSEVNQDPIGLAQSPENGSEGSTRQLPRVDEGNDFATQLQRFAKRFHSIPKLTRVIIT